MGSSSSSANNAWEELRIKIKGLRSLLLSPDSTEKQIRCEVKKLLTATISYYEDPHRYENNNTVLEIMSGRSLSSLVATFMWMGAWRPSAAVSLVFSVMGLKKQGSEVANLDIPRSLEVAAPALTDEQLSQLQSFRDLASQAEKDLSEEVAVVQMMLGDQEVVTDLMEGGGAAAAAGPTPGTANKFKTHLDSKVSSLCDVLRRADQLRIKTLLELHSILSPAQAARCSIAAFEAAFAMRSLNTATPASSSSSSYRK